MSRYVIRRFKDGHYVSEPGSERSYTKRLQNARLFPSREAAEAERCGNEYVEPALTPGRGVTSLG